MGQNAKNKLDKIIHNDNTGIAIILIVLCVITTIINPNFMSKETFTGFIYFFMYDITDN